jgi:sugar diacid utilization regulator
MSLAETRQLLGAWLTAVADVVRGVNAAEPLDVQLSRIAEQACRLVGFDLCAVMLVDPTGQWLQARGSHGLAAEYVARLNREHALALRPGGPDSDTLAAHAFRGVVTLAVPDILREHEYPSTRRWAHTQGFRALLAVPLAANAAPHGVLVAYSREPREFAAAEVELVELLAQHATLALETAELRAAQERTIAELSAKREVLEWAEAQHRRLMQLLAGGAGLQRLAELLAEALHASITIEDVDDTVLAVAAERPGGTATPAPDPATRKRRSVRMALESLRTRYEVVPIQHCGPDGRPAWVAPVVIGGQLVGRLWGTGVPAVPDPARRRMIERFALVVAVELLKQRDRVETENRLAGDLVDELLRTEANLFSGTALERAAALGHDLSGPQVLAVVAADKGGAGDAGKLADTVRAATTGPVRPLVGARNGLLVLILPADADPTSTLARVHELVVARAGVQGVATVLGPPVAGLDFAAAFSVAAAAVELCPDEGTDGVLDLRRLGLAAYLLRTGTTAALRSFADTLVRPLEEHDARKKSQLCATVRTWLAVGASVPAAAKALIVHPNTVAYRLNRAEQLLRRDLRATATRMELQLAFTVRDVQRARGVR